ncbi:MAG: polysaccharide biosynthesis C-terminal domain-containing protein, partial [Candidatus Chisholmbacteria bacterium]|nr:polysaccharide biosynthesis C-terminal domain-containing protein [Candidatus Chisholmbacteria bacterium]
STTLTNTLAALGEIKLNLKLMVMWTSLIWLLTPLFVRMFGFNGAALASALVAFTSVIPIVLVKKKIPFNFLSPVASNFLAALSMGVVTYTLAQNSQSLIELTGSIILGAIIYASINFLIQGRKIIQEIQKLTTIVLS